MELDEVFQSDYLASLENYIYNGGEHALNKAYELGRKSLENGQLIFSTASIHTETLIKILNDARETSNKKNIISAANTFFTEYLSPFVMTFNGFWDVVQNLKTEVNVRKKAEDAYRQSVKYNEALLRNALDIITKLNKDGSIEYCSASVKRILGYDENELINKNIFAYIHPDDVDRVLELFTKGINIPGFSITTELRFKHKNGDWVILEAAGKNLEETGSGITGAIVNSRDITDRRNLEEMRRKYEFIANASKELMGLINKDYKYEAVNEAYCTAISKERSEIIGSSVAEIFSENFFNNTIKKHIDECFENIESLHGTWFTFPRLGKRYLEMAFYPYVNNRNKVTHVVFVKRDVTERKKREDEIKESQNQLAEAQRIANMGSWEWKINSNSVWCSAEFCNIFGLDPSRSEISLQDFLSYIHSDDKKRINSILDKALNTGKAFITKHKIAGKRDNVNRILQTRGKVIFDDFNLASKIIGTSQDITKQELAQQAIKASEIKYRRLFETSKEGILLIDASTGIITDINPFIIDFLGYPKENYIGKKSWEIEPVKGIEESEKAFMEITEKGYSRFDELELNTAADKKVKIEFVSVAYSENTNKMIQCHVVDITERKLLQYKLSEAAKKQAENMKKFAHSIQHAQEEERLRISRELHDDICQRLTALKFKLNVFEDAVIGKKKLSMIKLKSAKKDIDNLIKGVREISSNLRPTALDHFGMVTALKLLCSESKKLHKVNINFKSNIPTFNHYDPNIEIALYRIGQEALTNSIKHSKAKNINLKISERDNEIILMVDDNGKGFDIEKYYELSKSENGHYGLINMRERTEQLSGSFQIESGQRKGTQVKVIIPLNKKSNEKN